MRGARAFLKKAVFQVLGKDPEGRVVSFATGTPERVEAMVRRAMEMIPDRRHMLLTRPEGPWVDGAECVVIERGDEWLQVKRALRGVRVAMAPVLWDGRAERALRVAAALCAPRKILAFNEHLESHHLKASTAIASLLFVLGVRLDRIWLRPGWWPAPRERSVLPEKWREAGGRGFRTGHERVAIVSPYLPWPLSHGGAVRLWALLERTAEEFDICYFGFEDGQQTADLERIASRCARLYLAAKPRYREPRWSTLVPPEVCEFAPKALCADFRRLARENRCSVVQAEYTQMAAYGPDVLVEHDVTFDLARQVEQRSPGMGTGWTRWRWERFERRALRQARRVVVMSEKDRELSRCPNAVVVPNGVDLDRFRPVPEPGGRRLLFVGSFRHFPNVVAWHWLLDEVIPKLPEDIELLVVAGPNPEWYDTRPVPQGRVRRLGFVADVKPLYEECNLVLIPTLVSAGTNLKALEAMAMERAMVSTPSGVAGIGLVDGESVCLETTGAGFAAAIVRLLEDPVERRRLAGAARRLAVASYGWDAIARRQREVWLQLKGGKC